MTDEQGRQLGNVERGAMHYRAADAGYTFVRIDLHERFNDPVVSINSRLARARGTEFRVDGSRTNESFFEERSSTSIVPDNLRSRTLVIFIAVRGISLGHRASDGIELLLGDADIL